MEGHNHVDPDFLKGFNEGYTIARYMPELADKLIEISADNPRNSGFRAGRDEYIGEVEKQRQLGRHTLPMWLRDNRPPRGPETPEKSKDKDIEPEK